MISKEDIEFRYYGDDSDSKKFRGVICGIYKNFIARREFYVNKDDNFKSNGDALVQKSVADIIREINEKVD